MLCFVIFDVMNRVNSGVLFEYVYGIVMLICEDGFNENYDVLVVVCEWV